MTLHGWILAVNQDWMYTYTKNEWRVVIHVVLELLNLLNILLSGFHLWRVPGLWMPVVFGASSPAINNIMARLRHSRWLDKNAIKFSVTNIFGIYYCLVWTSVHETSRRTELFLNCIPVLSSNGLIAMQRYSLNLSPDLAILVLFTDLLTTDEETNWFSTRPSNEGHT